MAPLASRETGQRRHANRALTQQRIEKRDPPRQPTKAGEKAELWSLPFPPYPARKAVDLNGQLLRFTHSPITPPPSPAGETASMAPGHRASSAAATSGLPNPKTNRSAAA